MWTCISTNNIQIFCVRICNCQDLHFRQLLCHNEYWVSAIIHEIWVGVPFTAKSSDLQAWQSIRTRALMRGHFKVICFRSIRKWKKKTNLKSYQIFKCKQHCWYVIMSISLEILGKSSRVEQVQAILSVCTDRS